MTLKKQIIERKNRIKGGGGGVKNDSKKSDIINAWSLEDRLEEGSRRKQV